MITHPDGLIETYSLAENSTAAHTYMFTLIDSWADSKGNTWYKAYKICNDCFKATVYEYGKISASGDSYEFIYHIGSVRVEEWEPDNPVYNYVVYYRL